MVLPLCHTQLLYTVISVLDVASSKGSSQLYKLSRPADNALKASGHFQTATGVFNHFYNGINLGDEKQASDPYCWVIGALFGAWVFFGYDAAAHLAEETHEASVTVARGMWMSTLSGYLLSVPTLIMLLFCIQDFDGIISATYSNNFAEYLLQIVGPKGAIALLSILWIDSTVRRFLYLGFAAPVNIGQCSTASCFMSAQV